MKLRALEISEVNSYIKRILTNDAILYNLKVKGEISNFKVHSSGNVYLSLKDEKSKINCVIFKNNYNKDLHLDNGSKVIANGYISLYERDGSYQLYINDIEIEGLGNLYIEFNKLKEQLSEEGLFDIKYKKSIPSMPKSIGVITSETGAVIRDIINVIKRRYPKVNIKLYPVNVQGSQSKYDICEGIKFFNNKNNVDIIIVGRGGGSIEELWSFNEEIVAREVFNSKIPIISAVGHETDFTICDFVSDLRAPTPSAAAELVYPQYSDIVQKISTDRNRIIIGIQNYIIRKREYVKRIKAAKLEKVPLDIINRYRMIIDSTIRKSENNIRLRIERYKSKCMQTISKLDALSPLKTLTRGYSVVENKERKVIKSVKDVKKDDKLNLTLVDGKINVIVE